MFRQLLVPVTAALLLSIAIPVDAGMPDPRHEVSPTGADDMCMSYRNDRSVSNDVEAQVAHSEPEEDDTRATVHLATPGTSDEPGVFLYVYVNATACS